MRYWLDTEFIEDGKTIDLISIGIVAEDGRELYLINDDCDFTKANDWVRENVLSPMGIHVSDDRRRIDFDHMRPYDPLWQSRKNISQAVLEFVYGTDERPTVEGYLNTKPEFWGYYADYDWVVFCQLFGTMMDLPKGFPMYCRDIKQWCDELGNPKLPEQGKGEHNALADARWNKQAWEFLRNYSEDCVVERD